MRPRKSSPRTAILGHRGLPLQDTHDQRCGAVQRSILLSDRPMFIDYHLYEVIGTYLFSGNTKLPTLKHLRRWHRTMKKSN